MSPRTSSPTTKTIVGSRVLLGATAPTMSHVFKRFMSLVGKIKLEDPPKLWQEPVRNVLKECEQAVCSTKLFELRLDTI